MKTVTLKNGLVLWANDKGNYPPLKDIIKIDHACEICPIRPLCLDNNEIDCQIYGMFQGYYADLDASLAIIQQLDTSPGIPLSLLTTIETLESILDAIKITKQALTQMEEGLKEKKKDVISLKDTLSKPL